MGIIVTYMFQFLIGSLVTDYYIETLNATEAGFNSL